MSNIAQKRVVQKYDDYDDRGRVLLVPEGTLGTVIEEGLTVRTYGRGGRKWDAIKVAYDNGQTMVVLASHVKAV